MVNDKRNSRVTHRDRPSFTSRSISEYVYDCGASVMDQLGFVCSPDAIKDALISRADVIQTAYGMDLSRFKEDSCISECLAMIVFS